MNICHLVFRPDSLTYTVAKALTHAEHNVVVCVVDPEHDRRVPNNIQRRLASVPRVTIVARDNTKLPAAVDRLIVQVFPRPLQSVQDIDPLATLAARITVITAGDRSKPWRQAMKLQWLEARTLMRHARKVDRVAYKDGFYPYDLYGLFKSRHVVGFDVHSQFLHSEEAFRAIHARDWSPESPRPILASFLGSQDPDSRRRILDGMRDLFISTGPNARGALTNKSMYWHEYSDAVQAPLGPKDFLDVLSRSDFSLCPPGYSLVTHRPMEALLRGSIPVLPADQLNLYDVGLEDEVNCIGVPIGGWRKAIQRLASTGDHKVIEMRRNIYAMLEHLSYETVSKQIRLRLGVSASSGP
jgi:hypothetical protein